MNVSSESATEMPTSARAGLRTLVYSSTATVRFTSDDLRSLLIGSRRANAALQVTGMLLYRNERFIQVLEGAPAVLERLFASIAGDPRHHDVRVLLDESIAQRQFAEWTMGFQPFTQSAAPLPTGYRDSFEDLASSDDEGTRRALRELTLWFTVRTAAAI